MKGQPYGACQTVTALASGRRPQRPIAAGSPRRTRDVFRTGNPGEASSVTDAHNWAFRVTQKRQPDHLQAAQNRQAYSYSLPLLVPACLFLDGPADLPQMPPEGV